MGAYGLGACKPEAYNLRPGDAPPALGPYSLGVYYLGAYNLRAYNLGAYNLTVPISDPRMLSLDWGRTV